MKLKDRIKRERDWINEEYGIITPTVMALFRLLQFLPFQVFIGNRTDNHDDFVNKSLEEQKKMTRRSTIIIEVIMLVYMSAEILTPLVLINSLYFNSALKYLLLIVFVLRLIDILQVNINLILFDGLRFKQNPIAKYSRAIVLLIWNYFEIILIFGYLYFFFKESLSDYKSIIDAYYFSTITQLTIGYGDLNPLGSLKIISGIQGLIGTLFLVLIIAKVINMIPNLRDFEDKNTGANTRS